MSEQYIVQVAGRGVGKTGELVRRVVKAVREAMPSEVVVRGELDAAWAEAEAALPEGWLVMNLNRWWEETSSPANGWWGAVASKAGNGQALVGSGPTPAAALRALAAKLREVKG